MRYLRFLRPSRHYAAITGTILFLIGLLGFAFRSSNSLPDMYLLGSLIFGFWGILVSFGKK